MMIGVELVGFQMLELFFPNLFSVSLKLGFIYYFPGLMHIS
jgi:hypothetical protein